MYLFIYCRTRSTCVDTKQCSAGGKSNIKKNSVKVDKHTARLH